MLRASWHLFTPVDRHCGLRRFLNLALIAAFALAATGSLLASSGEEKTGHILLPPGLPTATLQTAYSTFLSVRGGHTPYAFTMSRGELPAGLTLNSRTGRISGDPTQAGSFEFTIAVRDGDSASGTASYKLVVSACTSCVKVTVSPLTPTVVEGEKLQFSATVTNRSNTAVVWSASAGTISADGLFTAPPNSASKTITITAKSAAEPSAQASTPVAITGVGPTISTSRIPDAVDGTAYSVSLVASGGQTPYRWSIVSGSLPAGLQLGSTTGAVTGKATKNGSFSFSVVVTDAAAHSSKQSLTMEVSSSTVACGPPAYSCSRTDHDLAQLPTSIPNVGGVRGANTIVTDPAFGNRIVRITDWGTDPGLPTSSRSFVSASSGSADENLWNLDSTLFIVQSVGDAGYPYTFDPTTMQASRMYISSSPSTKGLKLTSGGTWSRSDANLLYTATGTSIYKYDFTDRTNPPSPQLVFDFTSTSGCLPVGFDVTWRSKGGVSFGDTVFGMAYSNTGGQGTAIYAVAYKVGSGCTVLNTRTGQVAGDWGASGTIGIPDRWAIHNAKLSKDGNWLIVAPETCLSSNCSQGPYFWQIGTTNVSSCGDGLASGQRCGGHWTEGTDHWVNNNLTGNQVLRPFAEPTEVVELTTVLPHGLQAPLDDHASWNNADPADSLPFFLTTWSTIRPFPAPWYNEITGVATDGSGKVWRFAHSFITGRSHLFSTAYGIGSISQDGRFFIFSSDWMGTLGAQDAASTCKIAKNCRGDVFVVELK